MRREQKILSLDPSEPTNARNLSNAKELIASLKCVAVYKGKFRTPIDVRWYMSRSGDGASPVYCSVWFNDAKCDYRASGHGKASGYGYCKQSASLEAALDSAGVKMSWSFGGAGSTATQTTLEALARKLGFRKFTLV